MASTTFHVDSHWIALGQGISVDYGGAAVVVQGYVACYGGELTFLVYFLDDMAGAPAPSYDEATGVGVAFAPSSAITAYLAVLDRAQPTYAYLDSEYPERNCLRTGSSAMGRETA